MSKQSKRRRAEGEATPKPKPKPPQARRLPAWVLPVVVLLVGFAVVALALIANNSPTRR